MCGFIHHALDAGTLCDRSPLPYDPHCDILIEAMRTQELWQIDSELQLGGAYRLFQGLGFWGRDELGLRLQLRIATPGTSKVGPCQKSMAVLVGVRVLRSYIYIHNQLNRKIQKELHWKLQVYSSISTTSLTDTLVNDHTVPHIHYTLRICNLLRYLVKALKVVFRCQSFGLVFRVSGSSVSGPALWLVTVMLADLNPRSRGFNNCYFPGIPCS